MPDLTKAINPVPRADGLKMGSANTAFTTPDPTFGEYSSGYKDGDSSANGANIFGPQVSH